MSANNEIEELPAMRFSFTLFIRLTFSGSFSFPGEAHFIDLARQPTLVLAGRPADIVNRRTQLFSVLLKA